MTVRPVRRRLRPRRGWSFQPVRPAMRGHSAPTTRSNAQAARTIATTPTPTIVVPGLRSGAWSADRNHDASGQLSSRAPPLHPRLGHRGARGPRLHAEAAAHVRRLRAPLREAPYGRARLPLRNVALGRNREERRAGALGAAHELARIEALVGGAIERERVLAVGRVARPAERNPDALRGENALQV